jgi:A/G-specific adenine glycosylase
MQEILSRYDITEKQISNLHEKIFVFYDNNKRDLPWRDTFDRYKVRVSETMLQQTQVKRVIEYFHRWMTELPDVYALAACEKWKLLALRSWLGFNSRVLRLQQCARLLVEEYHGDIPKNYSDLMKLPGIWPYTAGAIMNFAFNTPAPMVDTNIRRILIAELGLPETIKPKELNEMSYLVTPLFRANDRGNALMDYGALYFTAQKSWIKPISKQSKFAWSQRQVRWWIVKQLSSWKSLFLQEVSLQFPRDDLMQIISKMSQEGLITFDGQKLALE